MKIFKFMMLAVLSVSCFAQASWRRPVVVPSFDLSMQRGLAERQKIGLEPIEKLVRIDQTNSDMKQEDMYQELQDEIVRNRFEQERIAQERVARENQERIAIANQMLLQARTVEQVQDALTAGADVHARDNYGQTALMSAAFFGHENAVRILLDEGADVNARSNNGTTALMGAALQGYEHVARLLLDEGADVNARNNKGAGATALMAAAAYGHENVIQFLLGWNDQMDALLARDDISDEAKLRLVPLEPQAVQDTLDGIQTARQDQANLIHECAMAVRPEMMQMLQDYLDAHPVSDYLLK